MIIAEKVYELPTAEPHKLTIVEIQDKGVAETMYGPRETVSIKIRVDDQKTEEGGEDIYVYVNGTKSIGAKSTIGKFLRSKLNLNVGPTFDTDELIGFKFEAVIEHNVAKNGKTYANVGSPIRSRKAVVESV